MGNVTGQDRSGYLLRHDLTTKEVRRFFVVLDGSWLSLYTDETRKSTPTKIDLLQFANVSKGGTNDVPRIELLPRDEKQQSKLSFIASPVEADCWVRQVEAVMKRGQEIVDEDVKVSETKPTQPSVEHKDKVQTRNTSDDDEREALRKQLEKMAKEKARLEAEKAAAEKLVFKETTRLNALQQEIGSKDVDAAGSDSADNEDDDDDDDEEICVPVSRESRRASSSSKVRYRSYQVPQGSDFNVCWEFNSAAGCKMGKWCRWTHTRLKRKSKWKGWNSGSSWGERSYSKPRSRDRSGKREQYVDENRERGEQSTMRARTKETKYNKQKSAAVVAQNSGNGKEELYSKMQRKVMADNRRLKMGSNYSSNPYEDTQDTDLASTKAEQDESEADEIVRFGSSSKSSAPKELPQRTHKSSRRRERERKREPPVAVAGPPTTMSQMTVPMAAAMSATSSIPNASLVPQPRTMAPSTSAVSSSSMLLPLFPPLSASTHPTHSQQVHPASASKPYHPLPSVTTATSTTTATATAPNTRVYHTYRTTQSTPNPNPTAATSTHPYGHSHYPSVANGYKAHTAHERVDREEPTGYYGSNLGWGPSWSPRRKRKYVLVQKNQTIY